MAREGISDIFIAYPVVGRCRFERLAALTETVDLSVGVDSAETAKALAEFFHSHSRTIDVLVKVDTGQHRCGCVAGSN